MISKLANLFSRPAGPKSGRISIGAFGKHPGWEDHIDDIGLDTPRLVFAKRVLYTEGISHCIDSAVWDSLPEDQRLANFSHHFLWRFKSETLVGVLWSSRDAKGRSRYPMVLCAHAEGWPTGTMCGVVLNRLLALRETCRATAFADEVRGAVREAREQFATAAAPELPADADPDREALGELAAGPSAEKDSDLGLVRILYEIEHRMGHLRATGRKSTAKLSVRAEQFRAPGFGSAGTLRWAQGWMGVVFDALGVVPALSVGVLAIEAVEAGHVDVFVGPPAPEQLSCVRAGRGREPLTTEIPFTIEADFDAIARDRVRRWRS